MSSRDLSPVEENVERPEKLSQSFLSRMDVCARSGMLYLQTKGGHQSHAMARGECFHEFARRFVELLVEHEEHSAPPEVAKDVLASVIADRPDLQLPEHELDSLRVMAYHMAENYWIEPSQVVALERMLELEVGDWHIRGKVDFASVHPETHSAVIRDYKTGFHIGSQSDFAKSWQCRMYALLLAEGKGEDDPIGIGRDIDSFKIEEVYPAYRKLPTREAILSRQQLRDFREDVLTVIARAELGFNEGIWPAVPGSQCSTCSAPHLCPLPKESIPAVIHEGEVEAMAERCHWLEEEAKQLKPKLKASATENGGAIAIGSDLEYGFELREAEKLRDKEVLKEALRSNGLDPDEFFVSSTSTVFTKHKVKA